MTTIPPIVVNIPADTVKLTLSVPLTITIPAQSLPLVINYEALAEALAPYLINAVPAA